MLARRPTFRTPRPWVLAACADDGATATLRPDRRSGMACAAAPAGGCAGVATATDGFVAFGATAVRRLTARKVVTQTRPLTPPSKPLEDHGDALEAPLRNVVDGKSAPPLSSIFAAAPSSDPEGGDRRHRGALRVLYTSARGTRRGHRGPHRRDGRRAKGQRRAPLANDPTSIRRLRPGPGCGGPVRVDVGRWRLGKSLGAI